MISDPTFPPETGVVSFRNFSFFYGSLPALQGLDLEIEKNRVTAIIGPSGCGKTTLLRSINRLNDDMPGARSEGEIFLDGTEVTGQETNVIELRRRIGMVFQKSNPFPCSIYDNVSYGLRLRNVRKKSALDEMVENSLRAVALWDEVKDRLNANALRLSGGQMQRLCIARAIANQPELLLMDEPCSALDPVATGKIEELIQELKQNYTILVVTHNMQQAGRCSDNTAFLYLGKLIEYGRTEDLFMHPRDERTEAYVSGRFG